MSPPPASNHNPWVDALVVLGICAAVGVGVDLLWHPEGIPLVATHPYQTLVPCPALRAETTTIAADDPRLTQGGSFLVDAREQGAYARHHLPGAHHVPYDYLDPTPEQLIKALGRRIAASGARRVIVYGDGDDPDTGQLLATELAAQGLRHVMVVRGGYGALRPKEGATK